MTDRLRVLFVPDSVYWVTGTIAKSIARFNPWIEATIMSGPVLGQFFSTRPDVLSRFDLVHFICPFISKEWLPRLNSRMACVTSHHHVADAWDIYKHNLGGDAIVTGSQEWADDLSQRGADMSRVFCIPYGVDAEQFRAPLPKDKEAIRKRLRISSTSKVVGFFGKNSSDDSGRKGTDVFLDGVRRLKCVMPELAVLIVGPGWKAFVRSIEAAGIRCLWFPFIETSQELSTMYHAIDFYWVTARVEGGPVPLLEAMSSELCCLTTPVGLARELVKHGEKGMILPFNDPAAFADNTVSLTSDDSFRCKLGQAARATILREMHVGLLMSRIREVYGCALRNSAARRGVVPIDPNTLGQRTSPVDDVL